jgi:hypothetical protein
MLAYRLVQELAQRWREVDLTVQEGLQNLSNLCGSIATLQSPDGRLAECSWHLRFVVYSSGDNLNRR